jgi:hypothetical protein
MRVSVPFALQLAQVVAFTTPRTERDLWEMECMVTLDQSTELT